MVEMGVVAGAYGLKGWVKVIPWSEDREALLAHGTWWVGGAQKKVSEARQHGAQLMAQFAGLSEPEEARGLKGRLVCVPREALPPPEQGQYYFADLVGMDVVNEQGFLLGVVKGLASHGAQDVMEVQGEQLRMLPWVDAVVKRVDMEAGRIEVDWESDW